MYLKTDSLGHHEIMDGDAESDQLAMCMARHPNNPGNCLGGDPNVTSAASIKWWNGMVAALSSKDSTLDKWEKESIVKLKPLVATALTKNDLKEAVRLIDTFHEEFSFRRRHPDF